MPIFVDRGVAPTAEAFYRSLIDFQLDSPHGVDWIYRGQADHCWGLLPKAFRADPSLGFFPVDISLPAHSAVVQRRAEANTVMRFLQGANQLGLSLPVLGFEYLSNTVKGRYFHGGDLHSIAALEKVHETLGKEFVDTSGFVSSTIQEWPPKILWELLALARHYGVPTRLLDWSYDPRVAAYFAAAEAARWAVDGSRPLGTSELAVWLLDRTIFPDILDALPEAKVQAVQTRSSDNANLIAQRGLFTLVRDSLEADPRVNDLRFFMDKAGDAISRKLGDRPALQVIRLSINQAPRLLGLLHRTGISAATLFPGFGSVVESMREEQIWVRGA